VTNKQKTSHFFVYSRGARRTIPTIRGMVTEGVCAIFVPPLTFLIRSAVSPLGVIENLWDNEGQHRGRENAYNLVVCPPKATKLKT